MIRKTSHIEQQGSSNNLVYLNYAATSFPKNPDVIKIYNDVLLAPPSGIRHGTGVDSLLNEAKHILADGMGVETGNIYFSSGATQALNEIIFGSLKPGDHGLYDNRSHNAVVRPMCALPTSIKADMCPLYKTDDSLDIDELLSRIKPTTKLLCLVHASNVTGTVYDVKSVINAVREQAPQTKILVDAAQSAGAVVLDDALSADFVVFQGHKHLHAPAGAAVVVAQSHVSPIIFGGGQAPSGMSSDPFLFEVGTQNHAAIFATAMAFKLASKQIAEHHKHEESLLQKLEAGLAGTYGLQPLLSRRGENRVAILALRTTVGTPEFDWVPRLAEQNIVVRGGLHCSPCLHQQHELEKIGTLRLSLGWSTTEKDIDAAIDAVRSVSVHLKENGPGRPMGTSCTVSFPQTKATNE